MRRRSTSNSDAARGDSAKFPKLHLKLKPPLAPMDAKLVAEVPLGPGWQYEPKWDGFRAIIFRDDDKVVIQSKAGEPLGRYFPEIVEAIEKIRDHGFVLDGEIVIEKDGKLDFDALLQRIHPAPSRIQRLSKETPAKLLVFDLLEDGSQMLTEAPLRLRREVLSNWARAHLQNNKAIQLSPASTNPIEAERWLRDLASTGCDGVIAKLLDEPYHSGDRRAMQKIKRIRSADCVVGGFRYASKGEPESIGSLLLGLYDGEGKLNHVGFTSSFSVAERRQLAEKLAPAMPNGVEEDTGFSGSAPGGPSRWNAGNPTASQWVPLLRTLVVEVSYDHFAGGRFRHGTKLLRWRPDKAPRQCTMEQVEAAAAVASAEFGERAS